MLSTFALTYDKRWNENQSNVPATQQGQGGATTSACLVDTFIKHKIAHQRGWGDKPGIRHLIKSAIMPSPHLQGTRLVGVMVATSRAQLEIVKEVRS